MKFSTTALLLLAPGAAALKTENFAHGSAHFGPKNCVTLTRSAAGSCTIATDCQGLDTSQTEFAFDCIGEVGKGDIVRHSFGVGGFEANEEFDTEVKCGRCAPASKVEKQKHVKKPKAPKQAPKQPPAPVAAEAQSGEVDAVMEPGSAVKASLNAAEEVEAIANAKPPPMVFELPAKRRQPRNAVRPVMHKKTDEKTEAPAAASINLHAQVPEMPPAPEVPSPDMPSPVGAGSSQYGPNGCVSINKNGEGHCVIATSCEKNTMKNYDMGLVCVDDKGYPVKHLFGKDSFDDAETFDTLVKCDKCLGLDNLPDSIILAGDVATMGKQLANLKAVMMNVSQNVKMLNDRVFPKPPAAVAPAPAPAAGAAPAVAAAAPKKALVHADSTVTHHKHHHRRHLRHRHHRHRDSEDEEDDRDDDRDDRRDDRREDRRDDKDDDDDDDDDRRRPAQQEAYTPLNNVEEKAAEMQRGESDDDDDGDAF